MEDVTFSIDETAPIVFSVESLAVVTPDDFDLAHASMTGKDANDHPQYLLVSDWGAHPAYGIIAQDLVDYAAAYGWGDHAGLYSVLAHDHAGVYSVVAHTHDYSGVYSVVAHTHDQLHAESHSIESHGTNATAANLDVLVGGAETSLHAHAAGAHDHDEDYLGIADSRIAKWDTAYGWGDHDGLYSVVAHVHDSTYIGLTDERIVQWEAAYGWGDHAGLYSVLAHDHDSDYVGLAGNQSIAGNKTFTGNCIYSEPLTVPAPVQDWHAARVDWVNSSIASDIAAIDLSDLHSESHTIASHGTNATEGNLDTLVGTGYADLLHKHLNTNYDYSLTVAQNGTGDFTSIQAAIDSITDNDSDHRYQILVYPGKYAENVVGKSYVGILGFGGLLSAWASITPTTGIGFQQNSGVGGITAMQIEMAVTTSGNACVFVNGSAVVGIQNCRLTLAATGEGLTNSLIRQIGGVLVLSSGMINYSHNGNSVDVNTHNIIDLQSGLGADMYGVEMQGSISDSVDNVSYVSEMYASLANTRFQSNHIAVSCTATDYSGHCAIFNETGASLDKDIFNNLIQLQGSGGTGSGEIYHIDTPSGGKIRSASNRLQVLGFGKNYIGEVLSGDELISHFDYINCADGVTGDGLYTCVNAPSAGDIQISGSYLNMYSNAKTVGARGADFTSIQDAIDSITVVGDSSWVIILYPGTYTENVTLKAGVSLVGIGSVGDVTIQEEEGTVLTIPYTPFSVSVVRNLTLKCAVSGISTAKLVASGGFYTRFDDVVFDVDIANGSMTDIELTSGTTTFESCLFQHDSTGTSAGDTVIIKNKGTALFNVSGGTGSVVVESIANTTHVFFIEDESSTDVDCDVFNFKCSMLAETAGFAGLMEFWRLEYATVENRIQRSYIHLSTPSGATSSVGAYVDVSTAGVCVYSSNNDVSVTGFDENYTAAIAASAVCNSHFDNINAVDGVTGAGVYNFVNSPSPGNIQCSGGYLNMYDAVKTVGPRGCDYTEIQVALDDNPEPNILFTIQPDTYVNDTLNFTANNQTIQGVSESNKDAEITNTTTICDYGAFTNCKVSRVYVKQTQSSSDPVVTGTGTGSCHFDDVINELICGAGTGTGAPLIPRNYTGTGDITILRGEVIQSNASSTTNIDYHNFAAPIEPSAGGSITVDGSKVTLNQTGKHYICFGVGTLSSGSFEVNRTEIIVNTTSCQFAVGLMGCEATGVNFAAFNKISVIGTSHTALGVYGATPSALTINSSYSSYIIEGGTSNNFGIEALTPVIVNTSFDVYLATTFSNSTGTVNSIRTDSPGNLSLSGSLKVNDVLNLPIRSTPSSLTNGDMWMESDGLHIYRGDTDYLIAGIA